MTHKTKFRTPLADAKNPKPEESVLQWCENLVAAVKHKGKWAIPRSAVTFMIDKPAKTLWLTDVAKTTPTRIAASDFFATAHVFAHIGWRVKFGDIAPELADAIKAEEASLDTENNLAREANNESSASPLTKIKPSIN